MSTNTQNPEFLTDEEISKLEAETAAAWKSYREQTEKLSAHWHQLDSKLRAALKMRALSGDQASLNKLFES